MLVYNCVIVEDEPLAAEVLRDYIKDVPFLKLVNQYLSAIAALAEINKQEIDLIFLDINLPKLKGMDFLKTLKNPPHVIVTSAYHEYALQGYELNVIDYLLKPIEFGRFLQAVNKLKFVVSPQLYNNSVLVSNSKDLLFVNVGKNRVKIQLKDILYIESQREYVKIVTAEKLIITKCQLSKIEEQLNKSDFLRIHRSFLVARNRIDAYSNANIELNGKKFPIGRSYKALVIDVLNEY